MNKISIILLAAMATAANADVFKCQLADKTVYQSMPCPPSAINQHILELPKTPPEKAAEAEQRLHEWETDFEAREAAELKARQEQAKIDALRRSAKAQEDLANSARQPVIIEQTPVYGGPYPMPFWGRGDWNRHDRDRHDWDRDDRDDMHGRPMPSPPPRSHGGPPRTRWITP